MGSAVGALKANARELLQALSVVALKGARKSRRRKVDSPISLKFDRARSALSLFESHRAAKAHEIEASGSWPDLVQVEGRALQNLISKLPPEASIEVMATPDDVTVVHGSWKATLPCLDATGKRAIELVPVKGPETVSWPKHEPDPDEKRAEWDDTWSFSARVPIPQHRKPSDK